MCRENPNLVNFGALHMKTKILCVVVGDIISPYKRSLQVKIYQTLRVDEEVREHATVFCIRIYSVLFEVTIFKSGPILHVSSTVCVMYLFQVTKRSCTWAARCQHCCMYVFCLQMICISHCLKRFPLPQLLFSHLAPFNTQ
jgi:hypothetical protein